MNPRERCASILSALALVSACASHEVRPTPLPEAEVTPPEAEPSRGDEWVCTHLTQGIAVDPAEQGPCEWTRRPECPGMFVVYSQSSTGLVGSCATSLPPSIARP